MTTTAHEDQYLAAPEPVREPLSREAILKRNIADLEVELKQQTERAESYAETLRSIASYVGAGGYNADTVDAGVFEDRIRWGIRAIQGPLIAAIERAEAAEAELEKLAQQKPVAEYDGVEFSRYTLRFTNGLLPVGTKFYVAPVFDSAVEENRFQADDLESLHMCLRDRNVPTHNKIGQKLSAWGRVSLFAEMQNNRPAPAPHKGATHCDDCGLTWLDDGLNPLRCPYCKDAVPAPAVSVVCKDCGQSWTDSTAHANLCAAEMLRQDTKQAPAVQLVDGSDDYYDYLGALVEQHPAGVMRRNTDDKAPAVPTVDRAFESYCDNRAVLNGAPGELKDTTPAVLDDPLLCDTCGADCGCNPWHYSKDVQHHLHACGDCHEDCIAVNERNARRYLALRKVGVQVPGYELVKFDWSLDAAADRLLEGGE